MSPVWAIFRENREDSLRTLTTGSKVPRMKNRIREVRESRGLSQQRLAELSGLTTKTIADIEAFRSQPRIATAFAIANALELDIADLFDESAA